MERNGLTIRLAGEAGQGVESSGAGFARALARGGLEIFAMQDYMSRIRGGLNAFQIRVADRPVYAHGGAVHLVLAFNDEAMRTGLEDLVEGGGVIYDEGIKVDTSALHSRGIQAFPLPLAKLAAAAGSRLMANTAAVAAAAGLVDYPLEFLQEIIAENFGRRKGSDVARANQQVAETAYAQARDRYAGALPWTLEPRPGVRRLPLNGNQALALGALAAGCRFLSAYPMTPATSIMEWMAAHADAHGVVVKQAEDEIAAVCMAIGAAHVGARAMTATSGGGFSLMVEALGLAGITETPLVIVEVQRAGPSTGMPTRTEQSDLLFALTASQGEFPRVVLAPGTVEQCFDAAVRAFNLAERYQLPVIILSDQYLASSFRTADPAAFELANVRIDRGALLGSDDLDGLAETYRRYLVTDTGISPRALPGHPRSVFLASSDEHDESGHFADEDAANRVRMTDKRLRKLAGAAQEMRGPEVYGPAGAEVTLVGWGSTYGPLREAVDRLQAEGQSVNLLHFTDIWPLPMERVAAALRNVWRLVPFENNATGQFATFFRALTGHRSDGIVLKYDGRQFSPDEVAARLRALREEAARAAAAGEAPASRGERGPAEKQ